MYSWEKEYKEVHSAMCTRTSTQMWGISSRKLWKFMPVSLELGSRTYSDSLSAAKQKGYDENCERGSKKKKTHDSCFSLWPWCIGNKNTPNSKLASYSQIVTNGFTFLMCCALSQRICQKQKEFMINARIHS